MENREISILASSIVFVGYGNSPEWDMARKRVLRNIKKNLPSANLYIKDQEWLKNTSFYSENKVFFDTHKKGYGLWVWKPLLILDAMKEFPTKKYFIYLDLGCELNLNRSSVDKFIRYLQVTDSKSALAFEGKYKNEDFTSEIILNKFNYELTKLNQIYASVIFFKNEKKVIKFIENWLTLLTKENFLFAIGHHLSSDPLIDKHRHDQSILSLIWRDTNFGVLPDESYWQDWRMASNIPLWVARNRLNTSIKTNYICRLIFRIMRKIQIFIYKLNCHIYF